MLSTIIPRFMTLSYRDSMGDSAAQPFGVIVETTRYIYYLGFQLDGDESSVTGRVLANFPDVLGDRIVAASSEERRGKSKRDPLDTLYKEFAWNIRASAPTRYFGLDCAFLSVEQLGQRLFKKHVLDRSPDTDQICYSGVKSGTAEYKFSLANAA